MLQKSRVTHKSNIIYLEFKLLSTHIVLGGQDGGQDAIRKPRGRKHKLNEKPCKLGAAEMSENGSDYLAIMLLFLLIGWI